MQALQAAGGSQLYVHYFDVDVANPAAPDSVYPVAVLREVDTALRLYDIVPVVFVTPRAIKATQYPAGLARRIAALVQQMHEKQFGGRAEALQIDCDWTPSTREAYFQLLEALGESFKLSATIRLHQVKYKQSTGIPPVQHGALMLYNMSDLDDFAQNSIINMPAVRSYLTTQSSYPLPLDVALPLYSQVVLKSPHGRIKLINGNHRAELQAAPQYFRATGANTFSVLQDTLYRGFFLYAGYQLKVEEAHPDTALSALQFVQQTNLRTRNVLFYHLDSACVSRVDFSNFRKLL